MTAEHMIVLAHLHQAVEEEKGLAYGALKRLATALADALGVSGHAPRFYKILGDKTKVRIAPAPHPAPPRPPD